MKGSDEGFRPPYVYRVDGRRLPHVRAHANINSSNANNINNANNHNQDFGGSSHTLSSRVLAAHGNESGSTRISTQLHHYRQPKGPPDDHRHWIDNGTSPLHSTDKFILVSYNILGVENANQHWQELYRHIPPFIMEWMHRKRKILLELRLWSPDIICLQEVDRFEDLQKDLVQQGYEGIYKGRTGESTDGCAIFWRNKKFKILQEESIEYQEFELKHNVAQLCVLQTRGGEQKGKGKRPKEMVAENRVLVCNIHVLFNPNRGDIKLGQVRLLLEKAFSLSQEWGGIPVVVAGDFNSIPQSPLYQFIRNGALDLPCHNRRAISGQMEVPGGRRTRVERWTAASQIRITNDRQTLHAESSIVTAACSVDEAEPMNVYEWTSEELKSATGNASESLMRHNLKLESAYSSVQGSCETRDANNEPLVTTYHRNFMGTVDYIWFTKGLVSLKVLEVLPVHILRRTNGLPSKKWGSDHLALASEFAFSK